MQNICDYGCSFVKGCFCKVVFGLITCIGVLFSGAPSENIVQNHLNIELLNVF